MMNSLKILSRKLREIRRMMKMTKKMIKKIRNEQFYLFIQLTFYIQ